MLLRRHVRAVLDLAGQEIQNVAPRALFRLESCVFTPPHNRALSLSSDSLPRRQICDRDAVPAPFRRRSGPVDFSRVSRRGVFEGGGGDSNAMSLSLFVAEARLVRSFRTRRRLFGFSRRGFLSTVGSGESRAHHKNVRSLDSLAVSFSGVEPATTGGASDRGEIMYARDARDAQDPEKESPIVLNHAHTETSSYPRSHRNQLVPTLTQKPALTQAHRNKAEPGAWSGGFDTRDLPQERNCSLCSLQHRFQIITQIQGFLK